MLLVIDHHDSFTWNLVHALGRALSRAHEVLVCQSDTLSVEMVRALAPVGVVLSPGPGRPEEARTSLEIVRKLAGELPMLGVCLGHQVLCAAYAAKVRHAPTVYHGRVSAIHHDGQALFANVPSPFRAARYHSLVVDPNTLPGELVASAFADSGELMAVRHRSLPLWSLQFHPESFLTEHGQRIVQTFVDQLPLDSPSSMRTSSFGPR
jgi:anthranilate synthase/aminodeoxychorismate synthase-like glutamine amidotransferase